MSKTTFSEFKFFEIFSTEDKAVEFYEKERWKAGRVCPCCGSKETYPHKTRKYMYHCRNPECRKQFSCKTNTVMQASKLPIRMWLYAMYKVSVSRKGISSLQLAKELGITQKSAWYMLIRIKESCGNDLRVLRGRIEIDETYIGGKEANRHEAKKQNAGRRGAVGKQAVMGMKERDGRVVAMPIEDTSKMTFLGEITVNVEEGSTIYTDEHRSYSGLEDQGYEHETVNHSSGEYVRGKVHTNNIESVWALTKRTLVGTHHHVSPKHLRRYMNEIAFRLNEGNVRQYLITRIQSLCSLTIDCHVTYKSVTS